jgi:hypothetical protein
MSCDDNRCLQCYSFEGALVRLLVRTLYVAICGVRGVADDIDDIRLMTRFDWVFSFEMVLTS